MGRAPCSASLSASFEPASFVLASPDHRWRASTGDSPGYWPSPSSMSSARARCTAVCLLFEPWFAAKSLQKKKKVRRELTCETFCSTPTTPCIRNGTKKNAQRLPPWINQKSPCDCKRTKREYIHIRISDRCPLLICWYGVARIGRLHRQRREIPHLQLRSLAFPQRPTPIHLLPRRLSSRRPSSY